MVVEPSVSTAGSFLTSTFFSAIRVAVRLRDTVTVASSPSGTFATMMPIMKSRACRKSPVLRARARMKKVTPNVMAMAAMILTKWWISRSMLVGRFSVAEARLAMCPIIV
eukprot:Lithocolla_globosa_v1_NODE_1120_length_2855_cov_77.670357.p5 type:complete len:110 gc:universal NODE_1120_length_2855_cov_77.670357:1684-2013(+)